jgi:hypothetical protein
MQVQGKLSRLPQRSGFGPMAGLIVISELDLLILEERLREQAEQGVAMPAGYDARSLAALVLMTARGVALRDR